MNPFKRKNLILPLLIIGLLLLGVNGAFSDELEEVGRERAEKEQELLQRQRETEQTKRRQSGLSGQLSSLRREREILARQTAGVESSLGEQRAEAARIEMRRREREEQLSQEMAKRDKRARLFYKQSRLNAWELFLGSEDFAKASQDGVYYQMVLEESKKRLLGLGTEVQKIKAELEAANLQREKLEKERVRLQNETLKLQKEETVLGSQIRSAETYLNTLFSQMGMLEGEIKNLTQKQEALIRAKLAATAQFASVGEFETGRSLLPDPPFTPSFAVASRGYPHRVGLNQYGAYGRAKAGENFETILKAYYQDVTLAPYPAPERIPVKLVSGEVRNLSLEEEYLKGIAEMPSSWPLEAQKAQAVAARSYALAYTKNGTLPICSDQNCQVFREDKVGNSQAVLWHLAVSQTRGLVLTQNGQPITAWYASTAGGFTRLPLDFDVGWGGSAGWTKRVVDLDAAGKAFDGPIYGNSPWYYKVWYSREKDLHPWLTAEEMEDLLDAALLPESYNPYLTQEVPVVSVSAGWGKEQVRAALRAEGKSPVGRIQSVKTADSEEGYTQFLYVVSVNYPGGVKVDGRRFRSIFVLRSRGNLALWSSLYDILIR